MSISCDASDLSNLARCFDSCGGDAMAIRSYLLCQYEKNTECVAPPAITEIDLISLSQTSLNVSWIAPISINTGFRVRWGTSSGNYNLGSVDVDFNTFTFNITGLSPNTTYYINVLNLNGTCVSAAGVEAHFTTSPTNGLLNGLVSYWKFDNVSAISTPDSVGANTLTLNAANSGVGGGIINGDLDIGAGGSYATHADNADFSPAANTSIAFSGWISASDYTNGGNTIAFCTKTDGANGQYQLYIDPGTNKLAWVVWDSGGNVNGAFLTPGKPVAGFHHVACGFDSPTKAVYAYYDGVFQFSVPLVTSSVQVKAFDFRFGEWVPGGLPALPTQRVDEFGMWHRTLSATDVANLYNGGAALPLSSFTV